MGTQRLVLVSELPAFSTQSWGCGSLTQRVEELLKGLLETQTQHYHLWPPPSDLVKLRKLHF